jgi:thiamine pyrophosphokinase
MKRCVIVGSSDFTGIQPDFSADYVIAADGGYDNLARYGIKADLIVGDLDSISCKTSAVNCQLLQFSAEKDASDLKLAVDEAISHGFECFYIYGCLGRRLDHTLASVGVLAFIAEKHLTGWLIGDGEAVTAITDNKITLNARKSGVVSVFSPQGQAKGVTITGLKYSLENGSLDFMSSHGLSNEFIGETAVIEVKDGTLIIILPKRVDNP